MTYTVVFKSGAVLEADLDKKDVERLQAALTRYPQGVFTNDTVGISLDEIAGFAPSNGRF